MQALNKHQYLKHEQTKRMAIAVRYARGLNAKDWQKYLKSKG